MADVFTVKVVEQNDTKTAFQTDCKTYLDTLTATNIDSIQVVQNAQRMKMIVVSHA